jgi:hypothetical protein
MQFLCLLIDVTISGGSIRKDNAVLGMQFANQRGHESALEHSRLILANRGRSDSHCLEA